MFFFQICGVQGHTAKRYPSFYFISVQPPCIPAFWHLIHRHQGNPMLILLSTPLRTFHCGFLIVVLHTMLPLTWVIYPFIPCTPTPTTSWLVIAQGFPSSILVPPLLLLPVLLSLNNVLCVPSMKKNLISISQFYTSSHVSIEFLPYSFLVEELHTRAILFKGWTKNGAYEWPDSPSSHHLYLLSPMWRLPHLSGLID